MIVLDSHYFPCISYFSVISKNLQCKIEQQERFRKMSFRNRCIIAGSNGLINLTVPIEGGRNNRNLMKDIRISYSENWASQHWKGILSSYSKSPYLEYYQSDIEQLIKKQHIYLLDKNMEILFWLKKVLKLSASIELTAKYFTASKENEFDYRNNWLPNNYLNDKSDSLKYFQMFEEKGGFHKNLSVLDLLFCEGSNANFLLQELGMKISV